MTKKLQKRLSLQKTNISVVTYGSRGSIIKVMGKIELTRETKNKFCCETFYVIDTAHKNLLSGKSAMALEILSFKKPIYHVQREPDVKDTLSKNKNQYEKKSSVPECLKPLINEFTKDVLSNKIGKLKDYQVTLHIDKNITPVAQRERRIPFALREKVNKELEKLEKAGIRGGYRIFFKYVTGPKLKIENFSDFRKFPDFPIWYPFISPISCSKIIRKQ